MLRLISNNPKPLSGGEALEVKSLMYWIKRHRKEGNFKALPTYCARYMQITGEYPEPFECPNCGEERTGAVCPCGCDE